MTYVVQLARTRYAGTNHTHLTELFYKAGKLGDVGKSYRPLTDVEMELARTKKELAEVKMERDILKKAAAYFARESLPGTR